MTNLEALKANLADAHGLQFTENHFSKALVDQSIQSDSTYYALYAKSIDLATISLYEQVLGAANMKEGDVDYSVMNKEYIEAAIDSLLVKCGLPTRYGKLKSRVTGTALW